MSEVLDLSPGALFADQFRVVKPLARGGMGAVYVVEQVGTARERALKLMHPLLASDARSVERFTREAQVASQIESDHVVEVVAAGFEAKTRTPWLCMELLKGETLAERVERAGRLSIGETLEVAKQLGHALSAAHRAGIVHRDLKPENVFLATPRREGIPFTLKVLDFGVAAFMKEQHGGAGAKTTQGVGSPMWMAPEQTNVGHVTPATDVWALGLIAFYLLTGKSYWKAPSVEGASLTALLVEIMVEPLVPATLRANELLASGLLPPGFDAWFARAVARDVGQRYPDASGAITDLVAVLEAAATGQPPRNAAPSAAFAETSAMPSTVVPDTRTSLPTTTAASAPAAQPTPNVAAPKPASRAMSILMIVLAIVTVLGLVGMFVVWQAMNAATEVVRLATAEGPSSDIHVGPQGVQIRTPEGDSVTFTEEGIDVQAHAQPEAEGETDDSEAESDDDSEAESDDDSEADDESEAASDDESEDEEEAEEPDPAPAAHRAPRRTADDAATAAARRALIDPCWRATYEGETPPPSARWTFDFALDATHRAENVRITGPSDDHAMGFRRCVVQRVRQLQMPDDTDHVTVMLP